MSTGCKMRVAALVLIVAALSAGTAAAQPPPGLLPEPESVRIDKNRFISFSLPDAPDGTQWAVRVKLVKLYNTDPDDPVNEPCPPRGLDWYGNELSDLSVFEGQVRWVETPEVLAGTSWGLYFIAAPLGCCPEFREWAAELDPVWEQRCGGSSENRLCAFGVNRCVDDGDCARDPIVHVYGAEVLPCSQYLVQLVDIGCPDLLDEACYSEGLMLHTAKWGDVTPPSRGRSQPNFTDIGFIVDAWKGIPIGQKIQAMLRWNIPPVHAHINFTDLGNDVDAWKAISYREVGPSNCTESCE